MAKACLSTISQSICYVWTWTYLFSTYFQSNQSKRCKEKRKIQHISHEYRTARHIYDINFNNWLVAIPARPWHFIISGSSTRYLVILHSAYISGFLLRGRIGMELC